MGRPVAELRHDLRGRLASVELHLALLESGPPTRRAHYLAVLRQEVELMAALVDQLGGEGTEP
jgi:signal transduction histidine kinase